MTTPPASRPRSRLLPRLALLGAVVALLALAAGSGAAQAQRGTPPAASPTPRPTPPPPGGPGGGPAATPTPTPVARTKTPPDPDQAQYGGALVPPVPAHPEAANRSFYQTPGVDPAVPNPQAALARTRTQAQT